MTLLGAGALWAAARRARRIELRGKVAVVTGGGRGLGHAIARELADAGCKLAICGRDAEVVELAVKELRMRHVPVFGQACDTSDERSVEQFINQVIDHYGAIDVLVNNAAQCFVGPAVELEAAVVELALRNIFWVQFFPPPCVPFERRIRLARRTMGIGAGQADAAAR
jgi:NAD(P)-dependent dehydrogenase (short-subunit alcohol dehydrogenase family)